MAKSLTIFMLKERDETSDYQSSIPKIVANGCNPIRIYSLPFSYRKASSKARIIEICF